MILRTTGAVPLRLIFGPFMPQLAGVFAIVIGHHVLYIAACDDLQQKFGEFFPIPSNDNIPSNDDIPKNAYAQILEIWFCWAVVPNPQKREKLASDLGHKYMCIFNKQVPIDLRANKENKLW